MPPLIITETEVTKLINKLKIDKSPGPDQIHPRYLKDLVVAIATPLTMIFKNLLKLEPKDWKRARVGAIYKKGKKSYPGNYRPVSPTSIVCKIMESIVRKHIIKYMQVNKLFSPNQYGFVTGRSTVLQLRTVLDKWSEALDMGLSVDCIYTDFQKAFDTVPHRRLIRQLKSYNINEDIIGWTENFTTGRTQQVVIGEECSGWMPVTSGIPQGSCSPRPNVVRDLYNINDLPETVRSDVYLFADDTKIFKVLNSENDKDILQSDLTNLMDWSEKWLLSFHPDKCKHIHITRERGRWGILASGVCTLRPAHEDLHTEVPRTHLPLLRRMHETLFKETQPMYFWMPAFYWQVTMLWWQFIWTHTCNDIW